MASKSPARRDLLIAAGIPVEIRPADIDERAVSVPEGTRLALELAAAKALAVSRLLPGRLVLGADQTMSIGPTVIHKAANLAEARRILDLLRGRTHHLHSAAALARDGAVVWRGVDVAELEMRQFGDRFRECYLDAIGESVTETVGGYRLEGLGIHLFSRMSGDHATILGLPLLALLAALRQEGALEQ
ncbi:septum formation protein Maf [Blastochloris viridis]|uniref:Nucleoside triphosphate pyrophosphatase n=1 Tax=Blastochloris viridis TaxID=1079 RepID=A0A182D0G5_BLAVI|nr:septum formation protein Maf [Blastochloris viridis]